MLRPLVLALPLACLAYSAEVALRQLPDRVTVTIDGHDFGSLYFGKEANKPFFHPLRTPDEIEVTRGFPVAPVPGEPEDHPHQKGLWIGTERLSGMDLWENDRTYNRPRMGSIQFVDVTRSNSGTTGELGFRADWLSPEGKHLVTEDRLMTFFAIGSSANVIDVDLTLTAREPVTFEDHQDAIIGIRLAPAFDEKNGGIPMNAEGYRSEAAVRGRASRFLDWRTTIGGKKVGVAILDHPSNLHAPARWHMRSFGFFAANPFARKAFDPAAESGAKAMAAGEKLRLRYRVVVYSGPFSVEECWKEFAR